jgi:aspartyl/asparaginyl beta-hydroxylase (cupin superfamily)
LWGQTPQAFYIFVMRRKEAAMDNEPLNFEKGETQMTDYQFKYLMKLKDKVTALEQKNDALYQVVKTYAEAGKTPEEIVVAVAVLLKN